MKTQHKSKRKSLCEGTFFYFYGGWEGKVEEKNDIERWGEDGWVWEGEVDTSMEDRKMVV